MKKLNIKPNLSGIMLIVLGTVVIVLAILFFAVDSNKQEKQTNQIKFYEVA